MKNEWDILIAGGGVGGVSAALRAAAMGCSVALTEENLWLGGQITSQGVSALDEHKLMETFGGTALYYDFRKRIRQYYGSNYKLSSKGKKSVSFNPGCSDRQRRLSFEPIAGMRVINDMLSFAVKSGQITIFKPAKVIAIYKDKQKITGAVIKNLKSGKKTRIKAAIYIDATELGDLLPLAGIPYRKGVESYAQTHEPSAPQKSIPQACQAFNYTFALEWKQGSMNAIPKPRLYEEIKKTHSFTLNGMKMFDKSTRAFSFWTYRRIIDASNFNDSSMPNDITLINCICTDYKEDTIIDKSSAVVDMHLYRAKQLALSYLYWLQTEAPRDDGTKGYPEFKLRADIMGTKDGLAQHPYIRESRRIKSLCTLKEESITANFNHSDSRAQFFHDTIGIGWYLYTDIHWCCNTKKRQGSGQNLLPYQIPMGALLSGSITNFIAGAKNIGTTHITNGACRLQPVEWNIGESAGALAAYAIKHKLLPRDIYDDLNKLRQFQLELLSCGIPLYWFDDVPLGHDAFIPTQYLALSGLGLGSALNLHFHPDMPINEVIGAQWILRAKLRYGLKKRLIEKLEERISKSTNAQFAKALFETILSLA